MSTSTTQFTETAETSYTITFDRIGLHRDVPPLAVRVRDAGQLAEVIDTYAQPYLLSGGVRPAVDLATMSGRLLRGDQCGGSFTIAVADSARAGAR